MNQELILSVLDFWAHQEFILTIKSDTFQLFEVQTVKATFELVFRVYPPVPHIVVVSQVCCFSSEVPMKSYLNISANFFPSLMLPQQYRT
jgi:hypothetical protein